MMEDFVDSTLYNIFVFLTNSRNRKSGCLIKRHSERLDKYGDCSFPNSIRPWIPFILNDEVFDTNISKCKYLLVFKKLKPEDIILASIQWHIPIIKINDDSDRINLFFDRTKAMEIAIRNSEKSRVLIRNRNMGLNVGNIRCDPICETRDDLSSLRIKLLKTVIQSIVNIKHSGDNDLPNVLLSNKSSKEDRDNVQTLVCGPVINMKTGLKETVHISGSYIKLRQTEMLLIAQHKYGVRVAGDPKWADFLAHLGEAAVTFELLEIKPSSSVKINFDCPAGSSKGAAFVLYNCARLETLLRTFSDKVSAALYPPLPPLQDVDFSLLEQEEEWNLIYNYVLGFPSLISNCIDTNQKEYIFRPHLICSFLCSMVKTFSQYYRRIRILTEPRKHLLPVMFARIHMLQALSDTLKNCLDILNIKIVTQM